MREIKFRAWHKLANRMVVVDMIDFALDAYRAHAGTSSGSGHLCDIELMQYTGLKDKNGTEIYEDDIVRAYPYSYPSHPDQKTYNALVTWSDYEGMWILKDERPVEWCPPLFPGQKMYTDYQLEVIGNIHENLDLLEKAK